MALHVLRHVGLLTSYGGSPAEMRDYVSAVGLYILRISAILTDTDRIVISLCERIRILCHGYSTDMHYAFILFYFYVCCLH